MGYKMNGCPKGERTTKKKQQQKNKINKKKTNQLVL